MPGKKTWGQTVAGWFIEKDDDGLEAGQSSPDSAPESGSPAPDGATNPPGQVDYAAPSLTQTVFKKTPPPVAGGQVDFEAVFDSAGIDDDERQRVAKAIELLKGLPADTDAAVKKQIVLASLKAFQVPIEKIIEGAVQEIQALDGYIRNGAADTEKLTQESDRRIKQYEGEINNLRKVMQDRVQEQQVAITVCNGKKLEVQQILEFFGQDAVAAVVKASPKLHDPSGAPETRVS
jgi:hypothetical protein